LLQDYYNTRLEGEAKEVRVQELKSSKVLESKGGREVERRRKRLSTEIAEVGTSRTRAARLGRQALRERESGST
jgi:hypothetical protein